MIFYLDAGYNPVNIEKEICNLEKQKNEDVREIKEACASKSWATEMKNFYLPISGI